MTNTSILRRRLRDALEELSDTIDNLANLLDTFDAGEKEAYRFEYSTVIKTNDNGDSKSNDDGGSKSLTDVVDK